MSAAQHRPPMFSPPPLNGRRRLPPRIPRVPSPNIVSVIFFESPQTFFVVRSSNERAFDEVANTLAEMEWEFGTGHRVVGEPELGELYVARCTYDDRVGGCEIILGTEETYFAVLFTVSSVDD